MRVKLVDIILSCIVLHNNCRYRNLENSVDDDVKEMIRKESEVIMSRKHQEKTSEKGALKLGQLNNYKYFRTLHAVLYLYK